MTALLNSSETDVNITDAALIDMLSHLLEKDPEMAQAITVQHVLPWDCIAPTEEMSDYLYIIMIF